MQSTMRGGSSRMNVDIDAGLVQALLRGDPDACDRLVERYGERVYRLASHLTGTADDAEAAAQSALVTAVRTIGALQSDSSLGSWLDGLAARAAYDRMLARERKSDAIAMQDLLPPLDGNGHFQPMNDWSARVESPELQGELRHAMTRAVQALPPDYRAALVLHDVEGMGDPDIAEVPGLGVGAVRPRVHHSRPFLRKRLAARHDPAPTPAL